MGFLYGRKEVIIVAESINAAINRHKRLRDSHAEKVKELLEQARWCPDCQVYHPKDQFTITSKERFERNALISSDAGYGDDDVLGDVTYLEVWWVCPKGHLTEVKDRFIKNTTNRHRRSQRLVTRWE